MTSLRQQSSICSRCLRMLRKEQHVPASRAFSTTSPRRQEEMEESPQMIPRWKQTPPAMKAPFRLRPQTKHPAWKVNDKQEPLDKMYDRFFGGKVRGREMLPEEVKWLAVTHKSFDHARRGFNDRLAFLGKRIVDLQTSMALLNAPSSPAALALPPNEVYQHPSLEGLENVTRSAKESTLDKSRLAGLATSYGIDKVVRWHPRTTNNLNASGVDVVLAHTIYSIIGALALHRGGETAASITRDRVLQPLGLR